MDLIKLHSFRKPIKTIKKI